MYLITYLCSALLLLLSVAHSTACRKGQYLAYKPAPVCLECDIGTFMPEDNHNKTECYPCSTGDSRRIVLRECSGEEDAFIACKPGFFKHGNTCLACEVCETGYEIQACYDNINTICCPSDRFYIHDDSNGVKVCRVRTLPCRQGQFFVPGNTCQPCQPGMYMAENHHNNTACTSCQQIPEKQEIDGYVASVCNITGNSTPVDKDHGGRPLDIASFNCSRLPAVYKNCLDEEIHSCDPNQAGNVTDQCTAQSATAVGEFFFILRLVCTVGFMFLLIESALVKCKVWGSARSLLPIKYLIDKRDSLAVYLFIILFMLSVSYLITVCVEAETSENAFILLLRSVVVVCVGAVGAIAVSYVFLLQHVHEKTDPVSSRSISDDADETD